MDDDLSNNKTFITQYIINLAKAADSGAENRMTRVIDILNDYKINIFSDTNEQSYIEILFERSNRDAVYNIDNITTRGNGDSYYVGNLYHRTKFNLYIKDLLEFNSTKGYVSYLLGQLYYEGLGVEKDIHKSMEYFKLGAEKGHIYSMLALGLIYFYYENYSYDLYSPKNAYKYFEMVFEHNFRPDWIISWLFWIYWYNGEKFNVTIDPKKVIKFCNRSDIFNNMYLYKPIGNLLKLHDHYGYIQILLKEENKNSKLKEQNESLRNKIQELDQKIDLLNKY